ncbi:hypothetical protein Nmel_000625 [Mimus melanotis]
MPGLQPALLLRLILILVIQSEQGEGKNPRF